MSVTNPYINQLIVFNPLIKPIIEKAIKALDLPQGSHGLDAGCGAGLHTVLFSNAVGNSGRITGLDISPEFIAFAEDYIKDRGLSRKISFKVGDVANPPFENDTFDWVWSSDCVGYAPSIEPSRTLAELVRVTKPGGVIALFAWSSEMLLPGYPRLEARLKATTSGIAPFTDGMSPDRHFSRAIGWFSELGLRDIKARSFIYDFSAPLGDDIRKALVSLFEMRWAGGEKELSEKDKQEYQRLCLPNSPDLILNDPHYYGYCICTMFTGIAPR